MHQKDADADRMADSADRDPTTPIGVYTVYSDLSVEIPWLITVTCNIVVV